MTRSLPKDNWTEVSPEEMAAFLKTCYTPGRHDLMVVKYGHRVGIIEQAQIGEHLEERMSEIDVAAFKAILVNLAADHRLGCVKPLTGTDADVDFVLFIEEQAALKYFKTGVIKTRSCSKQILDNFRRARDGRELIP